MWPLVIGENQTSPRYEIPVDDNCLIQGEWKLLRGKVSPAGWQGLTYPNASTATHEPDTVLDCGMGPGCVFNVAQDPGEHVDLATAHPKRAAALAARLDELRQGFWQNQEKGIDACPQHVESKCACWMAANVYDGFMGPYQEVPV